jgi:hypothetical protein
MNEMIGYIFGTLRETERSLKVINKTLKHQTFCNNVVAISVTALATVVAVIYQEQNEQKAKIDALAAEIEELKQAKGE